MNVLIEVASVLLFVIIGVSLIYFLSKKELL